MQEYKTKLKKGDLAIVIAGKNKGKKGKILNINLSKGQILLEGVNQRKKFVRPSQDNPKGGIVNIEAPISISNVQFYDEKSKMGVRLGFVVDNKDQKKSRVAHIKKELKKID